MSSLSSFTLQSKLKLRDGNEIPILGFGTYEISGKEAYDAVMWALEAGYRHIDSAAWYENEKECGNAILDYCKSHNIPRSAIFFTTKLKHNNGRDSVKKAIQKSLDECGLGYIDMYLIHGPLGDFDPVTRARLKGPEARKQSWQAICEVHNGGMGPLKSIGISNFGVGHMQEIVDANMTLPTVNQIDLHPFMTRTDVVEFCKKHEIILEAWAPLVRGLRFKHPLVTKFAQKYGKSPAQILLRYSLQKGFIPLPKSSSRERVASNSNLFNFELSQQEVVDLDNLNEDLVTDWDPSKCP